MLVTVSGASNALAKDMIEAANFYANILMHGKTVNIITLDIEISKNLCDDDIGCCVNEDDTKRSRWFTIQIKKQSNRLEMFRALAHEMVHVKQYVKNELRSSVMVPTRGNKRRRASVWMGKPWFPNSKEDSYFDSPWEVEAYGREVGLYLRYLNFKGLAE